MDLNKEAEKYGKYYKGLVGYITSKDFIAGANSKYVQAKIIQAQIDLLLKYQQKLGGYDVRSGLLKQEIQLDIYELQQQLKQLEDENTIQRS